MEQRASVSLYERVRIVNPHWDDKRGIVLEYPARGMERYVPLLSFQARLANELSPRESHIFVVLMEERIADYSLLELN